MKKILQFTPVVSIIALVMCIVLIVMQVRTGGQLKEAQQLLADRMEAVEEVTSQLRAIEDEREKAAAEAAAAAEVFAASEVILTPEEFNKYCQVIDVDVDNWQDYLEMTIVEEKNNWGDVVKKIACFSPKKEHGLNLYNDVTMEYQYTYSQKVTYYNDSGNIVTLSNGSHAILNMDPHIKTGNSDVIDEVYWITQADSKYLMGWSLKGNYYEFMCKKEKHEVEISDLTMEKVKGQLIFLKIDKTDFYQDEETGELYMYVQFENGLRKYIWTEKGILVCLLDENRRVMDYFYPDSEGYEEVFQ